MSTRRQSHTIGTLADAAGINVETVRYYQRRGLMRAPARPLGGIRRYGEGDLARVRFIKAAQRLGFSLDEVAELLQLEDGTRCAEARHIAEQKLVDIRRRLDDLRRMESTLAGLVERCAANGGKVTCPLIGSLQF
jgi:MerR family transcriptional regulator, mercuric resistance operon regulatory protein